MIFCQNIFTQINWLYSSIIHRMSLQAGRTSVRAPLLSQKKAPFSGAFLTGANDGARTHDNRYHKPGLCQLSYVRH